MLLAPSEVLSVSRTQRRRRRIHRQGAEKANRSLRVPLGGNEAQGVLDVKISLGIEYSEGAPGRDA